jgi:type III secretion protein R
MGNLDASNSLFSLVIVTTLIGLVPFAMLLLTAYVKINVVLFVLRNALGLQQTPGNLVMSALSAVLALYISAPVITDVYQELRAPTAKYRTVDELEKTFASASKPVVAFLKKNTGLVEREFFSSATEQVWGKERAVKFDPESLFILIPAFMMHELTAAFKIGFIVYLPFLAIDLITANVLMALGMLVLSPTVIAVPFKLFLFVAIDGWNMLVRGLILSYAY